MLVNIFYFLINYFFRAQKSSNFPKLLHSFNFDNENTLKDQMNSKSYSLSNSIIPQYRGLNILDTKFDMRILREANTLKKCKFIFNLIYLIIKVLI